MTENQEPIAEPKAPLTVEEELSEYRDKYLRLLADLDNTRKRMQKEKQDATRYALDSLVVEMLAPIDNLENALKHTQQMSEETRNWALGFTMILSQFKDVLSNHGIVPLVSEGKPFDPQVHYAIETEETTDAEPGMVLKEFVKGYRNGERTVRHSRVKVSVAPGTLNKQEETTGE
jgi:molecular chaperone GrpE